MAREFVEIENNKFVNLGSTETDGETDTECEGKVLVKERIEIRGDLVGRYELEPDDGEPFTLLGSRLLDDKLKNVAVGTYVRITLLGKEKTSGGNNMKTYKVEVSAE